MGALELPYELWSCVVPLFNSVGERSTSRSHCPVSLLSEVIKTFEKVVNMNNKLIYYIKKYAHFSASQCFSLLE